MVTFPYGMLLHAGKFCGGRMWIPYPDWVIPGSFQVHRPSSKYPYNYMRYFFTKKYFKLVKETKPELIAEVMKLILLGKISPNSYEEVKMKKLEEKEKQLKRFEASLLEQEKKLTKEKHEFNKLININVDKINEALYKLEHTADKKNKVAKINNNKRFLGGKSVDEISSINFINDEISNEDWDLKQPQWIWSDGDDKYKRY